MIHRQATGSTTETVSFGSKFAGVADFAEELTFVFGAVRGVEKFTAKTAFETHFVPFEPTSNTFFRSVDGFAAFWAFRMFNWLERHFVYTLFGCISIEDKKMGWSRRR